AAPQVEAVDTNGAGDCHTGTFMAGLALGLDPVEAARRAGVAAARAVAFPGPVPPPEDSVR
ncbi:MAG: carbohydrate kinase family protein, partial [Bifidobacteriaceae bacterium]|nr:carbohydrate kinase family protein [Bifidobacteriaceae bacterium]